MGLKSFLDRLLQVVEGDPALRARLEVLYLAQSGLGFLSARLAKLDGASDAAREEKFVEKARIVALESILAVIDAEMVALLHTKTADKKEAALRREALEAIRGVLQRELGERDSATEEKPPRKKSPKAARRVKTARSTVNRKK